MRQIKLGRQSELSFPSNQTRVDKEVSETLVRKRLRDIMNWANQTEERFTIYVYVMGGHPKRFYDYLHSRNEVEVLWSGSRMPKWLLMLDQIVASHAGLIKVYDLNVVDNLFLEAVEKSMAALYILFNFDEQRMISQVKKETLPEFLEALIADDDPKNFIYQVDGDNQESNTGIYELISTGPECPVKI